VREKAAYSGRGEIDAEQEEGYNKATGIIVSSVERGAKYPKSDDERKKAEKSRSEKRGH